MFVEEIIIDGFKSYAQRTVVSGFDRHFNAITGLNGSGKSNILDAICFVLGISNLTQVRAGNLQDLVYKQGQAGVTKASVTIVFNNEDAETAPMGYEQFEKLTVTRQVVIGGRNKYLINGQNAQLSRVQTLFHSVQLNVNNPHFLIMQGRITKVLNMKPPETLGMVEEAAGTRMFEVKKETALRTIEKKQRKVEEISKILSEEITPTLEKLRKERSVYMQWVNNNSETERLSRLCLAYEFQSNNQILSATDEEQQEMQDKLEQLEQDVKDLTEAVEEADKRITDLTHKKDEEMKGEFGVLEKKATELSKVLVKLTSEWKHKKENLESERGSVGNIANSRKELASAIAAKTKELEKAARKEQECGAQGTEITTAIAELQRAKQAASAGILGEDESGSLADQLAEMKNAVAVAATEVKQADMRIAHGTAELKKKGKAAKEAAAQCDKMRKNLSGGAKEVADLDTAIAALAFDEGAEARLLAQKSTEEAKVAELTEFVNKKQSKLSRVAFDYTDPEKNFDRSRVKGRVANLFKVKAPETATALEVTAGGRLYNVVVDTEVTGAALLEKGRLAQKVTIIPLNKISSRTMDKKVVKAAEDLVGKENVATALSLVVYDGDLQAAMQYVFGTTFVVKDMDTANRVTFHKSIRQRCVTHDGDVFDPRGTLSGGSRSTAGSVLVALEELNSAEEKLAAAQTALDGICKELAEVRKQAVKFDALMERKQLKEHQLSLAQETIKQSKHGQLVEEVEALEREVEDSRAKKEAAVARMKECKEKCELLEKQMKNFTSVRDARIQQIESDIAANKKKVVEATKKHKAAKKEADELKHEIAALTEELEGLDGQESASEKTLAELQSLEEAAATKVATTKEEYDALKKELDEQREVLSVCDKEISQLKKEKDTKTSELSARKIELKKHGHTISRFASKQKDAKTRVEHMLKKHAWIVQEKEFFGKPGTDFDFKKNDPKKAREQLEKLEAEQGKLSKSINKKVMSMFEKAEQEYQDLMHKKRIIENDKSKIEAVIAELDEKKNEALKTTWAKVNKDFGSIFSTLLPGAKCKLEPPEGGTVLDGLCVRVGFGDNWKETLTELSGGQRSLLALSLILSLLLFKPAPMYILDEIDAALDLSHTQNIGQIIKTHFSHSQFIIVSLKEGMFNNANVLFKTKFVDGCSTVTRTTPKRR